MADPSKLIRGGKGAKAVMSLADEVRAEMAAEKAYKAGVHYADPNAKPTMKFSEALGITGSEGKTLNFTETDRSRVKGENMGGFGFSGLQHYSPKHRDANAVWGFGSEEIAKRKIKNSDPEKTVFTTYIGSPDQHKSNSIVVKDALKNVQAANQQNLINPEQIKLINKRIREARNKNGTLLFPSDFDITDPQAMNAATTFDRRSAISNALMGIGVQGPMRGLAFRKANPNVEYKDPAQMDSILRRESEPMLEGLPNYSVGPRLFTLDGGLLYRPDLNFAFPHQPTGTDMGVMFDMPTIREAAPDFIKKKGYKPNQTINARAMSMGAPSQFVDEAYLTYLQKIGRKKGGLAKMGKGGVPRGINKLKGIYNEVETSMGKGKGADFEQTASPLNIMREGTGQWTGKNLDVQLKDLEDQALSPAYQKAIEDSLKADRVRAAAGDKAAQARIPTFEKVLAQGLAMKQWVNSNLKNYVKKQMASPNDPVRALAEKGVTHIRDNGQAWRGVVPQAETNRMRAGLPTLGSGQSVEAKAWETLSDNSMSSMLPEDVPLSLARGNDWIKDLPEDERVLFYTHAPELGFEKLVDNINERMDAGAIRPDQLNKVSVADAVKSVHDERVRKEDLAKKVMQSNAATKTHKEYPTGYKWVEISANKDSPLPEGYEQLPNGTYVDPQGQGSIHNPNYIAMQDALEHEGNIMGHCVGDYCDEVYNKGTKILSLRDPKGESHATVQVLPQENGPPRIKQIKGKQDEPLIGKYRPMMADLVNTGDYSYVDELHNAGMKEKGKVLTEYEEQWLKSKGYQVPKYILEDDINIMRKALYDNGVPPEPPEVGMAKGGVPKGAKKIMSLADQVKAEMGIDRVNMAHKDVLKRTPEIQEAAALLEQGKLSPLQYKAIVDKYKPITPYASVPDPASEEDIIGALTKTNREAQGLPPKQSYYGAPSRTLAEGDPVGLRLDIPSYDTANTWVVTAHGPRKSQASGGAGTRIGYEPVASATDVNFSVSPKAALGIAKGASKSTIATMEGKWKPTNAAEAKAAAELYLKDPDWVQVGMDPERHSYFYDRKTRQPVIGAEQVIQIGPLVLAKKPKYGKHEDFPFAGGGLAHMGKGGAPKGVKKVMSLADQVRAEMAMEKSALPTATRDANLAKFLEPSAAKMRLYHGTTATEGGKGKEAIRRLKPSKEGSLGSGVYMTPSTAHASSYSGIPNDEAIEMMRGSQYTAGMADQFMADRASGRLREGQQDGNMLPVHVQMRNPLIIGKSGRGIDPAADALISLGMDEASAVKLVEKAYEEKGNIGKQIQSRAQAQGYDGIMQYRGDKLSEVVSYNPSAVKSAIGNQGTYDTSFPDLNKAHGGLAMAKGGRGVRGAEKVMTLADEVRAEMAAEKAAKLANPPANVKVEPAYPYQDRLNKVKPVYGARAILPREKADANKAAFLEPSTDKRRLYHGTKRNFTRFSPTTADSIFLTPDPTFASGFVHGTLEYKDPYNEVSYGRFTSPDAKFKDPDRQVDNANILPVRVQVRNPFDYENANHVEALREWLEKNSGMPKDRIDRQLFSMTDEELSANWTQMENPEFQKGIKALGHDAYYTKELDTKNLGVYNPNMVKSDIGNIGTWSTKTPEITEKKGGLV